MKEQEKKTLSTGRSKIGDDNRTSGSRRAALGDISVIRIECMCGHHKAFRKPRGTFCTKCRREQPRIRRTTK